MLEPSPASAPFGPPSRARAVTAALSLAAALLAASLLMPYWELTLRTAEHPAGVSLHSHMGGLEGEGAAVAALGGGPGAARLRGLAVLERSLATCGVALACMLVLAAAFVRHRWVMLLTLPAIAFPAIVVADTVAWLRSLGPAAAGAVASEAGGARLVSRLATADFVLETRVGGGLLLAAAAAVLALGGLVLHRGALRARA